MYRYNIILSNSDLNEEKELTLLDNMYGKQVDGIVMMTERVTDPLADKMGHSPVPIVLAGSIDESNHLPSVNIDYTEATYEAVKQLIENGNERIAFISGSFNATINKKYKYQGYVKALEEAGIPIDEALIFDDVLTYDQGMKVYNHVSKLDDEKIVPIDIEVCSFENSKLARMVRPQLSSVVLPLYDIGAVSMRLLTKIMNKEDIEDKQVMLPYRMESRNSTR